MSVYMGWAQTGEKAYRPGSCGGTLFAGTGIGCPSLSVKSLDDPLRDDPVAAIDESCVGCGNCGEVAEAAVLCPSFHRVDIVRNPGVGERIAARLSGAVIGWLQARRDRRRLVFGEGA